MPECWIIQVWLHDGEVGVVRTPQGRAMLPRHSLPPMALPSAGLPAEARFAGAGRVGGDDAYLYVIPARYRGERLPVHDALREGSDQTEPALPLLLRAALEHDAPQDFWVQEEDGGWSLRVRDLDAQWF